MSTRRWHIAASPETDQAVRLYLAVLGGARGVLLSTFGLGGLLFKFARCGAHRVPLGFVGLLSYEHRGQTRLVTPSGFRDVVL